MTPTPNTFSGFTPEQTGTIGSLSRFLGLLGPILVLTGIARIVLGIVHIWSGAWSGLLIVPEGLLLAFAGMALIAGSTDAAYLRDVKGREKEHLGNTYRSLNDAFKAFLALGCYLAFIHGVNLLVQLGS